LAHCFTITSIYWLFIIV